MFIWHSENDGPHPALEDQFYVQLDDENNGALRINDYEANGAHFVTIGFIGPNARQNAFRWNEFCRKNSGDPNDETEITEQMETFADELQENPTPLLKRCFWPKPEDVGRRSQ